MATVSSPTWGVTTRATAPTGRMRQTVVSRNDETLGELSPRRVTTPASLFCLLRSDLRPAGRLWFQHGWWPVGGGLPAFPGHHGWLWLADWAAEWDARCWTSDRPQSRSVFTLRNLPLLHLGPLQRRFTASESCESFGRSFCHSIALHNIQKPTKWTFNWLTLSSGAFTPASDWSWYGDWALSSRRRMIPWSSPQQINK